MADNEINQQQMIDLIWQLRRALAPQGHHVGGNLLIYYDPTDGRKHLAPDVFVALDAGPAFRASWKTWVEGKFPEVVLEVASPSTQQRDVTEKVQLYSERGAREYYIFDPAGLLVPPFRGYRLTGARAESLANPHGDRIWSPILSRELRVAADWLRVIDPATGAPYPLPEEEVAARLEAEHRAAAEVAARLEAERHAAAEVAARLVAERHAEEEAGGRRQAEEELARLRAELARLRDSGPRAE
jgi:hypothetical protein